MLMSDFFCRKCRGKACMKQMFVGAHVRETGPDLGLVKKWDLNSDGLIVGCGLDPKDLGEGAANVNTISNWQGILQCPDQDLREGGNRGRTLLQRVKDYSGNTNKWYADYRKAFVKMQSNGYAEGELVDGPNNFWSHPCCFESNVEWKWYGNIRVEEGTGRPYNKPFPKVSDPLECQKLCRNDDQCLQFRYNMDWDKKFVSKVGECYLYNYEPQGKALAPLNKLYWQYESRSVSGPKECTHTNLNCGAFKGILNGLDGLTK